MILLHGWLGSWGLWQETMECLSRYYRTYALDFWGFGESGKKHNTFYVQDFVSMVDQFMERMGIPPAPIVGHSMGGTVTLSLAIQHPERITKAVVIGSPIEGSSLNFLLKLFGKPPIAFLVYHNMWIFRIFYHLLAPFYTRDRRWPAMMDRDLSRTTLESFLYSIASLRHTDLRPYLPQVKIPTMGFYGDRDVVVHPTQWKPLLEGVPHSRIERFNKAGHFIMLDEPQVFYNTLRDFLEN